MFYVYELIDPRDGRVFYDLPREDAVKILSLGIEQAEDFFGETELASEFAKYGIVIANKA
jgi:hypothetical protein